jgi:hypothetical protein
MNTSSDHSLDSSSKYLIELGRSCSKISQISNMTAIQPTHPATLGLFARVFTTIKRFLHESFEWLLGGLTMLILLSLIAVIPFLNFISLGYLIQMGANISQSGRLADGLVGIKKSAIIGKMAFGTWMCFWPIKFVFELKMAAQLTDPTGLQLRFFETLAFALLFLTLCHVLWACLRGGKLRHFIWPAPITFYKWLKSPHLLKPILVHIKTYFSDTQLKQYFTLGFKAFLGAMIWLIIPVGLLIMASFLPPSGMLISLPAGLLLMWVVLHLPFLQLQLANQQHFKAVFDVKSIRAGFKKAPLSSWLALLITLLFALPLYLLKIELTPEEIAWLPSLLFVFFIFPARLLVGWAIYRANKKVDDAHWSLRWTSKIAAIPVLLSYAILVFVTQYLSWNGSYSLLEQHAFMVPAPWMGL